MTPEQYKATGLDKLESAVMKLQPAAEFLDLGHYENIEDIHYLLGEFKHHLALLRGEA